MREVRLDVISKISPCHRGSGREFSATDRMFHLLIGIRWLDLVQVPLPKISSIYLHSEKKEHFTGSVTRFLLKVLFV